MHTHKHTHAHIHIHMHIFNTPLSTYIHYLYTFTQCIDEARDILDTELTALVGESYNRAYGVMVPIQLLSELEETIQCLTMPERKPQLQETWWNRLLVRDRSCDKCADVIDEMRHDWIIM